MKKREEEINTDYSYYGNRESLASPEDSVLCLMKIVHGRFLWVLNTKHHPVVASKCQYTLRRHQIHQYIPFFHCSGKRNNYCKSDCRLTLWCRKTSNISDFSIICMRQSYLSKRHYGNGTQLRYTREFDLNLVFQVIQSKHQHRCDFLRDRTACELMSTLFLARTKSELTSST